MTRSCPMREPPIAKRNGRLARNPLSKALFVAERQLSALNMSNMTNVVKVMVVSRFVTRPSSISS